MGHGRSVKQHLLDHKSIQDTHWIWTGTLNDGYGTLKVDGKEYKVHRLSYCEHNGIPIDDLTPEMLILHDPVKCNIRSCYNPEHLRLGDRLQNAQDQQSSGTNHNTSKTHCKRGHKFTEGNTYYNNGERICRECKKIHARRYYWRKRGKEI